MSRPHSTDRTAARLTFIPALLSLVIVLHHPVLQRSDAHSAATLIAGIDRIALANAAFHALILFLFGVQALGLYSFAERLGLWRLWVRAGVFLFGLATILLLCRARSMASSRPFLEHAALAIRRCAPPL